jgi:hypothetical protein
VFLFYFGDVAQASGAEQLTLHVEQRDPVEDVLEKGILTVLMRQ